MSKHSQYIHTHIHIQIRPSTVAKGTAAVLSFLERKVTAEARERFSSEREKRVKMMRESSKVSRFSDVKDEKSIDTKISSSSSSAIHANVDTERNVEEINRIKGELELATQEMEKWNRMMEDGIDEKGRTLTSAKRFALKKLLARARAKCIRLERKLK